MYTEFELRQVPLGLPFARRRIEQFLSTNGLRLDTGIDIGVGIYALGGDELVGFGGLDGNTIKCLAVSAHLRDEGLSSRLVSHLVAEAYNRGHRTVRVYTKPANRAIFASLGFRLLAEAPMAILMECGADALSAYLSRLQQLRPSEGGHTGVIVMNANPFTLGHRYLIQQAAAKVDRLVVVPVSEDRSLFGYAERRAMIEAGVADLPNVRVAEGSDYAISSLTFPTYFLKELSSASDTQMTLDLDLFARHIGPALNAELRLVGSEPTDALTARYNELMHQLLPQRGIKVIEVERLQAEGKAVSASVVRRLMEQDRWVEAMQLVPPTTAPYLLAHAATRSLQEELDTTPKPGLVDRDNSGAHRDMDYALMCRSIQSLHSYFVEIATLGYSPTLPTAEQLRDVGLRAEQTMLEATSGINTHRGAIFSMGLTLCAAAHCICTGTPSELQDSIIRLASGLQAPRDTHGAAAIAATGAKGALAMAQEGYPSLFSQWLPYMQAHATDPYRNHKTLLLIMSELDDTNVLHRADFGAAVRLKVMSRHILDDFALEKLDNFNEHCVADNISPGGAADMLALTLFINKITPTTALID